MDKSTSKRKEREKEARREAILDAAAQIFSVKTYYEATLEEIAAVAELAKGTLYNYFKDKPDLFASVLQRGQEEFLEALQQEQLSAATAREYIRNAFITMLVWLDTHLYMERMILASGGQLTETFRNELMKSWMKNVEEATWLVADGLENLPGMSAASRDERYAAAVMIMSSAHAVHHRRKPKGEVAQDDSVVDLYVTMICRALKMEKCA